MEYNRFSAVEYAHKWAYGRNPQYYNFDEIGGDCTNFASQVLYAGSKIMNYTTLYGWYYVNSYNRTPSWTGVEFLYNFLTQNKGSGPYAVETDITDMLPGDIIQLSFDGIDYSHSPVIVQTNNPVSIDNILIAAHTYDRDMYPITNYAYRKIRFIHILGVNQ